MPQEDERHQAATALQANIRGFHARRKVSQAKKHKRKLLDGMDSDEEADHDHHTLNILLRKVMHKVKASLTVAAHAGTFYDVLKEGAAGQGLHARVDALAARGGSGARLPSATSCSAQARARARPGDVPQGLVRRLSLHAARLVKKSAGTRAPQHARARSERSARLGAASANGRA